jgi:hypothetical protein
MVSPGPAKNAAGLATGFPPIRFDLPLAEAAKLWIKGVKALLVRV